MITRWWYIKISRLVNFSFFIFYFSCSSKVVCAQKEWPIIGSGRYTDWAKDYRVVQGKLNLSTAELIGVYYAYFTYSYLHGANHSIRFMPNRGEKRFDTIINIKLLEGSFKILKLKNHATYYFGDSIIHFAPDINTSGEKILSIPIKYVLRIEGVINSKTNHFS